MQLTKNKVEFDFKKVGEKMLAENQFINGLFSVVLFPQRNDDSEEEAEEQSQPKKRKVMENGKPRAKSLSELQQRLQAITSKKKLTYKEKMTKKGLKNRMKKKNKQDERNAQQKLLRAQKSVTSEIKSEKSEDTATKPAKPVYNSEGKMVFSKFDFSNIGKNKLKKQEKDPQKLLKNLEKQKEKIESLRESGELQKAAEIKEKAAWKNALAKASGEKVKDDPLLLKKTLKRKEQKQRSSKKKWEAREDKVKKLKEEKQKKRTENIDKRKKEKKLGKLKKASKRGKIIPGF